MSEIALGRLQGWGADIAIILGSGLNELEQEAPAESAISYSEFSELPRTSVRGHGGRFALKQMHSWMMIADHINLTDATPLLGRAEFVDMTEPYSKQWRAEFTRAAI